MPASGTTHLLHASTVTAEEGTVFTVGLQRSATALASRADLRGVESDADLERALASWRQAVTVEGAIARLVYLSLYKMHQTALFGPFRVVLLIISNFFRSRLQPKIKLH